MATPVAAADDQVRFDAVTIALHWATAFLVLFQFGLAMTWDLADRETRRLLIDTHLSFGLLLVAVLAVRIVWRLMMPSHRIPPAVHGWMRTASKAVEGLLYFLLVAVVLMGLVARWSAGRDLIFFGLSLPSPLPTLAHDTVDQLEEIHGKIGWAIIVVAIGHAGAALYHHFLARDRVLVRMFPWVQPRA